MTLVRIWDHDGMGLPAVVVVVSGHFLFLYFFPVGGSEAPLIKSKGVGEVSAPMVRLLYLQPIS